MTASFQALPRQTRSTSTATVVAIALIATVAILGFIVAGITFFSLAIAFPIALPIAERFAVQVPAADAELTRQLASFAWVFAIAGFASLVAAVVTLVKTIQRLSPTSAE